MEKSILIILCYLKEDWVYSICEIPSPSGEYIARNRLRIISGLISIKMEFFGIAKRMGKSDIPFIAITGYYRSFFFRIVYVGVEKRKPMGCNVSQT